MVVGSCGMVEHVRTIKITGRSDANDLRFMGVIGVMEPQDLAEE